MDEAINDDMSNGTSDSAGNANEGDETQEAIGHESDTTSEERITIDDINIVSQMNSSQMAIDEEEQELQPQPTHNYNLRERPTRRRHQISLTQNDGVTGVMTQDGGVTGVTNEGQYVTTYPKTHAHVILTQMNIKEGLLAFGEKGNEAILKELRQLHQKNALLPIMKENLSYEERKKALRYLMFLKEKRDGTIKARGCADGRPQRQYTAKTDVSSPTVSLEALMLSCAIDAK